jgi:protein SCO1/2
VKKILFTSVIFVATLFAAGAWGQQLTGKPQQLEGVEINEHPGDTLPLDLILTSSTGETFRLGDYLQNDRPMLLTLVYYNCPMLCNLVLNGLADGVRDLDLTPGKDFTMMAVSFNPRETAELAAAKKKNYIKYVGRPEIAPGWIFAVGEADQTQKLADAVGFKYIWDEETQQYGHQAVSYVITPEGVISRYLYGIDYPQRTLRLSLIEASKGKIGSVVDRIALYCFHYDPNSGGYVVLATNVMKLGGVLTVIVLGGVLLLLWVRERRKKARRRTADAHQ